MSGWGAGFPGVAGDSRNPKASEVEDEAETEAQAEADADAADDDADSDSAN
jgi:hypothetical protein